MGKCRKRERESATLGTRKTPTALATIHLDLAQEQVGRTAGSDEEQVSTLHARPLAPDACRRVGGHTAVVVGAGRVLAGREGGRAALGGRDVRHADLATC